MGIEYFLFALMLFGMVLIVFFLFFYGRKRNKASEKAEWEEKEQKLMLLYFEVQDMIDAFQKDVRNITERIELQLQRVESETRIIKPQPQEIRSEERTQTPAPPLKSKNGTAFAERVEELLQNGMSEEVIAQTLKVSRNEVRFALKLQSSQK